MRLVSCELQVSNPYPLLEKRTSNNRARRRRIESDVFSSPVHDAPMNCSPISPANQQASPSSFIGSASVSPTSPRFESVSNTSARLEHLVMAIEQIEGGRTLQVHPETHSDSGLVSSEETSSRIQSEPYWKTSGQSDHTYSNSGNTTSSGLITVNLPVLESLASLHGSSESTRATADSTTDAAPPTLQTEAPTSTDAVFPPKPFSSRPIPHKYLHRPQVVTNSSH